METNVSKAKVLIGGQYPKAVAELIDNAKKSVKIVMYDWRWLPNDPASPLQIFNQSLVRAVRRGVKVRALVNSSAILSVLTEVKIEAKKLKTGALMHAKFVLIDDEFVVIGSHNISNNAFNSNIEGSICFHDETAAGEYGQYFENLWLT